MKKVLIALAITILQNLSYGYEEPSYDDLYQKAAAYARNSKAVCLFVSYKGQLKSVPTAFKGLVSNSYKWVDVYHTKSVVEGLPIFLSTSTLQEKIEAIDPGDYISFIGKVKTAMNRKTRTKEYYFYVDKAEKGKVVSEDFSKFVSSEYKKSAWYNFIMQKDLFFNQKVYIQGDLNLKIKTGVSGILEKMTDVNGDNHFTMNLGKFPYTMVVSFENKKVIEGITYVFENPKKDDTSNADDTLKKIDRCLTGKVYGVLKEIVQPSTKKGKPDKKEKFFYVIGLEIDK